MRPNQATERTPKAFGVAALVSREMHGRIVIATLWAFAATTRAADAPNVSFSVPPPFATDVTVKHYRKGEDLLHDPTFHLIATAPLTEYHGWFGPRAAKQADIHAWTVQVYATFSKKVAAACAGAKNSAAADLHERPGLLEGDSPSHLVARVRRKDFSWGRAVSFLSQSTQDGVLFAPVNGHLQYEVWGITHDQRYTVVASVSVSHPKIADWHGTGRVRVARSTEALKRDPDYKRIERCRPEEFRPSLTAFDEMLDALTIR